VHIETNVDIFFLTFWSERGIVVYAK